MAVNVSVDDRLVGEARGLGEHETNEEAVVAALKRYVEHPDQDARVGVAVYRRLVDAARRLGRHETNEETITAALKEYVGKCRDRRRGAAPEGIHVTVDDGLVDEARRLGRDETSEETVAAALRQYVRWRKQLKILDWVGKVDYHPDYDHKDGRRNKRP